MSLPRFSTEFQTHMQSIGWKICSTVGLMDLPGGYKIAIWADGSCTVKKNGDYLYTAEVEDVKASERN